jgi:hypothetical protein
VFEGLFDRFPTIRMGFLEAGCGWLPDLVHAFHEHWEKRIRDFDPTTRMPRRQFARELLRERVGSDGKRRPLRKLRQAVRLARASTRETLAADRDAFLFEHRALDHDPVDFFRRGQVFVSFESDDPAPAYLREALGEMGEDLACFSADYGHWDGVVTDCVKNVVQARDWNRDHLAKLLAGNCLQFYGERLASRVASRTSGPGDAYVSCMEQAGWAFIERGTAYPAPECWSRRGAGDPGDLPPALCFHRSAVPPPAAGTPAKQ